MNYHFQTWIIKFYISIILAGICYFFAIPLIDAALVLTDPELRHDLLLDFVLSSELYKNLLVSLKISLLGAFFSSVFAAIVAYGLAVFNFPFKKLILLLLLIILCIPGSVKEVPLIIAVVSLFGTNNDLMLWLPLVVPALGVFVIKQYTESILNPEILEAARIDGAGEWRIFFKIILPLIMPALVMVFLLQFTIIWYLYGPALAMMTEDSLKPVAILRNNFRFNYSIRFVFDLIPIIVLLLCSGNIFKFLKTSLT